jgi:hypothetical protein
MEIEKKRFVRYKEGAKLYGCKLGKAVLVDCEVFEKCLENIYRITKMLDTPYYEKYNEI